MDRNNLPTYRITSYGKNLAGKPGCTGVLTARLTLAEVESQRTEAAKRGETITIQPLCSRCGEPIQCGC